MLNINFLLIFYYEITSQLLKINEIKQDYVSKELEKKLLLNHKRKSDYSKNYVYKIFLYIEV